VDLFVYGTLMVPHVLEAVCGYAQSGLKTVLPNHRCRLVRGEVYPAIVPQAGEQVSGLLYRDLSDRQIDRLDAFEGEMYQRCPVEVVANGHTIAAQTYLLHPAFRQRLSETPWSLERFIVDGVEQFTAGYDGFARTTSHANPDD
jgi:gamma-glutamylcyclotransferase (GGCT)/AIG2-like uncharacterized protein YtfP